MLPLNHRTAALPVAAIILDWLPPHVLAFMVSTCRCSLRVIITATALARHRCRGCLARPGTNVNPTPADTDHRQMTALSLHPQPDVSRHGALTL